METTTTSGYNLFTFALLAFHAFNFSILNRFCSAILAFLRSIADIVDVDFALSFAAQSSWRAENIRVVVVNHSCTLHQSMHRRRADKTKPLCFQSFVINPSLSFRLRLAHTSFARLARLPLSSSPKRPKEALYELSSHHLCLSRSVSQRFRVVNRRLNLPPYGLSIHTCPLNLQRSSLPSFPRRNHENAFDTSPSLEYRQPRQAALQCPSSTRTRTVSFTLVFFFAPL